MDTISAYIIMEQTSEPEKPKITKVHDENGLKYVSFRACLQSFECFNRNGRLYRKAAVLAGLQNENIVELLKKGTWVGENGHPDSDQVKRIISYDPCKICHRIVSYDVIGNLLYGNIETLADDGFGKQFTNHLLQGLEASFSLRALAPIKKAGGKMYIETKPFIVSYDRVIFPSHREAYQDITQPLSLHENATEIFKKSTENISRDVAIKIMEEQVVDYVLNESTNVKDCIKVLDCAYESAYLSSDRNSIILKENGDRIVIPFEKYIRVETSNYLANLFK